MGYIETVAGDLDAHALDRLCAACPVRIQHRSGAMGILNGPAVAAARLTDASHPGFECGPDAPPDRTGVARRHLAPRPAPQSRPPRLDKVGAALTRFGITGVTPDLSPQSKAAIAAAMSSGELPQRVHLLSA